jgi:hypothetical protein
MKSNLRVIVTTIAAFAAFLFQLSFAGCGGSPGASDGSALAGTFTGAWRSSVQFTDGAFAGIKDLEFLYAFNSGGTLTESSNYDGAPPVPPAYGIWRVAGPNQLEATYTYYSTRPPVPLESIARGGGWLPAGRGNLTERITVAADGQTFDSTITLALYDQAGKTIDGGGRGRGHGVRIRF